MKKLLSFCLVIAVFALPHSYVFGSTSGSQDYLLDVAPIRQTTEIEKLLVEKESFTSSSNNHPISLLLSASQLSLGQLLPTNSVLRSFIFQITSPDRKGVQVFLEENKPLTNASNSTIPDTSCDNGKCTPHIATVWKNTLTFGLGFRCEDKKSTLCPSDFAPADTYRPFANPQDKGVFSLLGSVNVPNPSVSAELTVKVNTSSNHSKDTYTNEVLILAVPKL